MRNVNAAMSTLGLGTLGALVWSSLGFLRPAFGLYFRPPPPNLVSFSGRASARDEALRAPEWAPRKRFESKSESSRDVSYRRPQFPDSSKSDADGLMLARLFSDLLLRWRPPSDEPSGETSRRVRERRRGDLEREHERERERAVPSR